MSHTYVGQTQLSIPSSFVSTPSPSQNHVNKNQVGTQVLTTGTKSKSVTGKQNANVIFHHLSLYYIFFRQLS